MRMGHGVLGCFGTGLAPELCLLFSLVALDAFMGVLQSCLMTLVVRRSDQLTKPCMAPNCIIVMPYTYDPPAIKPAYHGHVHLE